MTYDIYSRKGCKYCAKIKQVMDLSELKYIVYELDRTSHEKNSIKSLENTVRSHK